jgi:ectoine hydroxylase-related dioxygenase (phytanoyl-CoA dioxygenase family)
MTIVGPDVLAAVPERLARDGVAVVPDVLTKEQAGRALDALWAALPESVARGIPAHIEALDPNDSNVRVFDLIAIDPLFAELIAHPVADRIVTDLLGPDYIVSNFTANIARPGSGSMGVHSDTALVLPEPWLSAQSVNIIWCLTDVHPDNGATLHIPGSHRYETKDDVPADPMAQMVPFEAPAGSIMVMEGRVWHTSGANATADEDRALLFGYYTKPHIRPQWNFTAALTPEQQAGMSPIMRYRLGLDIVLNSDASKVLSAADA